MDSEDDIDLHTCSTDELIDKIRKLKLHVKQLRNVIHKSDHNVVLGQDEPRKKIRKDRTFNFEIHPTRYVALKVAYLGWDYHGLASQEDSDQTIEAHMFNALLKTKLIKSRESAKYQRCGRTDKGVSAFQQVLSLEVRCKSKTGIGVIPPVAIESGSNSSQDQADAESEEINYPSFLNKVLPPEIRVLAWAPVPAEFSARYDTLHRTYKYYFPSGGLDTDRMLTAAHHLIGSHDFRNLSKLDRTGNKSSVREILEVGLEVVQDGTMVALRIKGRSFIWHQIRCIMAILLLVGKGQEEPFVVAELLDIEKKPKKPQYSMAVDYPLVLFEVDHGDIPWIVDPDTVERVRRDFELLALPHKIKSSMIGGMLGALTNGNSTTGDNLFLVDALFMGKEGKIHKPLMSRPVCLRTPEVPETQ